MYDNSRTDYEIELALSRCNTIQSFKNQFVNHKLSSKIESIINTYE